MKRSIEPSASNSKLMQQQPNLIYGLPTYQSPYQVNDDQPNGSELKMNEHKKRLKMEKE